MGILRYLISPDDSGLAAQQLRHAGWSFHLLLGRDSYPDLSPYPLPTYFPFTLLESTIPCQHGSICQMARVLRM